MKTLAAALLGAALLAQKAAPPGQPYIVVHVDGTEVELTEAPRVKGATALGYMWPTKTLISFPARLIDAKATAAANVPGVVRPTPPPPTHVPSPLDTPPLGNRVKMKGSRADIERELAKASGSAARPDEDAAGDGDEEAWREKGGPKPPKRKAPEAAKAPEHLDSEGRGESYWRSRADTLRQQRDDAEATLAQATRERDEWERSHVPTNSVERSSWAYYLQERRTAVEMAQKRVDEVKKVQDDLREEARKADAYPGWLR